MRLSNMERKRATICVDCFDKIVEAIPAENRFANGTIGDESIVIYAPPDIEIILVMEKR